MQIASQLSLSIAFLMASVISSAQAQVACTYKDIQAIRNIYAAAVVPSDCWVLSWLTAPMSASFCSNTECLEFLNDFLVDFPDCTYTGVHIKSHVQAHVDYCEGRDEPSPTSTTATPTTEPESEVASTEGDTKETSNSTTSNDDNVSKSTSNTTTSSTKSVNTLRTESDSESSGSAKTGSSNSATGSTALATAAVVANAAITASSLLFD